MKYFLYLEQATIEPPFKKFKEFTKATLGM